MTGRTASVDSFIRRTRRLEGWRTRTTKSRAVEVVRSTVERVKMMLRATVKGIMRTVKSAKVIIKIMIRRPRVKRSMKRSRRASLWGSVRGRSVGRSVGPKDRRRSMCCWEKIFTVFIIVVVKIRLKVWGGGSGVVKGSVMMVSGSVEGARGTAAAGVAAAVLVVVVIWRGAKGRSVHAKVREDNNTQYSQSGTLVQLPNQMDITIYLHIENLYILVRLTDVR